MTRGARPPGRRPRRRLVLAVLLGAVVTLGGWAAWRYATAPSLPAVDLTQVDPAVAEAVTAAQAEVRAAPGSAVAWGRLGNVLVAHNFRSEAAACYQRAAQLDPNEPRWPYLHGVTLQKTDPETALPLLERAVTLWRERAQAPRLRLAQLLLELDHLDEAAEQFRRLNEDAPAGVPEAHLGLGRIAFRRGHLADSLDHLGHCTDSPRVRKSAFLLRSEVHSRRGDRKAAEQALVRAAGLPADVAEPDPVLEEVKVLQVGKEWDLLRVQDHRRLGQTAQAQELARRAEQSYPDLYWLVEGRLRLSQGYLAGAEEALRKAVALEPASVETRISLGEALRRQEKYREAAECFRQVTEREPSYGPAYSSLGHCPSRQGDRDGAWRPCGRWRV